MALKTLAKINSERHITHDAGQSIHVGWDGHQFCMNRDQFACFVDVLRQGKKHLYAACYDYSVVQVDEYTWEIWLDGVCLHLDRADYRTLYDAALTTETRLHGFRAKPQRTDLSHIEMHLVGSIRPPRPIRHCWN